MTSTDDVNKQRELKEMRLRWKQQDLDAEKSIIHFLREQLRLHQQKADILIVDLNVMRRDLALNR